MNRLRPLAAKPGMEAGVVQSGRLLLTDAATENAASCSLALFGPLHYEAGYAYPLLVWLHGPGDDERQLQRIMPFISMRNFVAVAPRGTRSAAEARRRPSPSDEVNTPSDWPLDRAGAAFVQEQIAAAISAAAQRYHVHPERIFIAGFDTGGTLALRVALEWADRFAGALSICGAFPRREAPLARLAEARRVPLFIACGRHSRRYSPAHVCHDLRLLHAAGMDITLRQYAGGHQISPPMLADMNRWIMERIGCA